jgi:uncharacterized protein (TIGR04255 family)
MILENFPAEVYTKTFLDTVICQVRFSPLLLIETDTQLLARFQNEKVRNHFPDLKENINFVFETNPSNLTQNSVQPIPQKTYTLTGDFGSIVFSRSFLSLTTKKYSNWTNFFEIFNLILDALMQTYGITNFSRIGLRYINIIDKNKPEYPEAGLTLWENFIKRDYLSFLPDDESGDINITNILSIGNDGYKINNIIATAIDTLTNNKILAIDNDSFLQKNHIEPTTVKDVLNTLNTNAYNIFRTIITEELRNVMIDNNA